MLIQLGLIEFIYIVIRIRVDNYEVAGEIEF